MQGFATQPALTPEERSQKRKVVLRDTAALLTLLIVTIVLFAATLFLFRSFSALRARLAQRWLVRGEAALNGGHPGLAVEDLRSALAYSPGQRSIEIELAEALAGAGRIQEATSYFNTLWESEPGSGIINLQLARLAARQNSQSDALEHYRASIYGTWEGDGSVRRRDVRLELIQYLLSIHNFDQARAELLIALGNAPEEPAIKLQIAGLMERANDPASALQVYKALLQHGPPRLAALEGAGRSAFALGNFAQARDYMHKALAHPGMAGESGQARQDLRDLLDDSVQTLLLYPSPELSLRAQAERTLHDRSLVYERLRSCNLPLPSQTASEEVSPEMAEILTRWTALPQAADLTVPRLVKDNSLRQSVIQLVYDTERAADKSCGPATGENAMLNKIAANPGAVEAQ